MRLSWSNGPSLYLVFYFRKKANRCGETCHEDMEELEKEKKEEVEVEETQHPVLDCSNSPPVGGAVIRKESKAFTTSKLAGLDPAF